MAESLWRMCSIGLTSILRTSPLSLFLPFFCLRPPFPPRPWRRLDFPRFSMTRSRRHPPSPTRSFQNEGGKHRSENREKKDYAARIKFSMGSIFLFTLSAILPLPPNCLLRNRSSIRDDKLLLSIFKTILDILELLNAVLKRCNLLCVRKRWSVIYFNSNNLREGGIFCLVSKISSWNLYDFFQMF